MKRTSWATTLIALLTSALLGLTSPMQVYANDATLQTAAEVEAERMYLDARERLTRGAYRDAATALARLAELYPASRFVQDAYYWQAWALYRQDSRESLRRARDVLREQMGAFSRSALQEEARELELAVQTALARMGDASAAEASQREIVAALSGSERETRARARAERARRGVGSAPGAPRQECEDNDVKEAAVRALMQMASDRALPILRRLLAQRDECSAPIRKQAVFVLAQVGGADVADILLDVARNDPEDDVRESAVFWLSQVGTDAALDALLEILDASTDREIQDKAIFAIGQHGSDRAAQALEDYALNDSKPEELRGKAIFWLGQAGGSVSADVLIDIYEGLTSQELRERVFFSISQTGSDRSVEWLVQQARDSSQPVELRKNALFWAGQSGAPIEVFDGLYETLSDREMKEQVIFMYSQQPGDIAVERLIDIARNEEDAELRKKAIFWLGQSGSERAAEFLLELIEDPGN